MAKDLTGKTIVELAADLAAGTITQSLIRQQLGSGVLASVLGLSGGILAGIAAQVALDALNKETGIVDDIGSVLDDVGSVVSDTFNDVFSIFD